MRVVEAYGGRLGVYWPKSPHRLDARLGVGYKISISQHDGGKGMELRFWLSYIGTGP